MKPMEDVDVVVFLVASKIECGKVAGPADKTSRVMLTCLFFHCRDGRLAEGDQILAIDGQVLEAAISHQAAIGILQRARGVVDLVVARGLNPEVPHIPLISLPQQPQQQQQQPPAQFAQQQQHHHQQLSPDSNSTRSRSSLSSQQSAAASSRSTSPLQPLATTTTVELAATTSTTQVDVVQILTSTTLLPPSLGRSPSALSDGSKTGGDMVVFSILIFLI